MRYKTTCARIARIFPILFASLPDQPASSADRAGSYLLPFRRVGQSQGQSIGPRSETAEGPSGSPRPMSFRRHAATTGLRHSAAHAVRCGAFSTADDGFHGRSLEAATSRAGRWLITREHHAALMTRTGLRCGRSGSARKRFRGDGPSSIGSFGQPSEAREPGPRGETRPSIHSTIVAAPEFDPFEHEYRGLIAHPVLPRSLCKTLCSRHLAKGQRGNSRPSDSGRFVMLSYIRRR
jgi:hypothetical protein